MQQPSACGERLFLSQEWSDFSLTVRDGYRRPWRFPVHTVVLAAQSDVFRSMFEREFSERETRKAFICDIKPRAMELLLGYFYKGTANLSSWWDGRELLQAAHKYQVEPLVQHCARFLETALTLSNVCSIYNDATLYSLATLREKCLHLIHHGGFLVLRSKSFEILTKEALVDVIASPFLNVKEELKVYEALLRWAKMQCCRLGLPVTEVNIFRELKPFLKFVCLNDILDEEKSSLPSASLLLMQPTKRYSFLPLVLLSHCSSFTLREDPNSTLEISPDVRGNTLVAFSLSAPAHLVGLQFTLPLNKLHYILVLYVAKFQRLRQISGLIHSGGTFILFKPCWLEAKTVYKLTLLERSPSSESAPRATLETETVVTERGPISITVHCPNVYGITGISVI